MKLKQVIETLKGWKDKEVKTIKYMYVFAFTYRFLNLKAF